MPSIRSALSAALLAFAAIAESHMTLGNPPPYGNPQSSPLDPSGSNFPCQATSNQGAKVSEWPLGSTQELSFIGSAVHGGGSCQMALTTDTPATKSSKWLVIHSVEGGCPSKNAAGNLGGTDGKGAGGGSAASTTLADKYPFKIPESIKPGDYTFSWTWFNKIGNREMYQNCASVKITGGTGKRDEIHGNATMLIPRDETFPDLFKANIPSSDCLTVDSQSVKFPDPGKYVDSFGPTVPPTGPKCGAAGSGSSSPAGGSSPASSPATGSSSSPAAAPSSGTGGAGSNTSVPGVVDLQAAPSGAPAASADTQSQSTPAESPQASAASSPSTAASQAAAPQSPAAAAAPAQPAAASQGGCTAGSMVCSPDGRQFGVCDSTGKAVMQIVAPGTKCVNGAIAAASKRAIKARSRRFRQVI